MNAIDRLIKREVVQVLIEESRAVLDESRSHTDRYKSLPWWQYGARVRALNAASAAANLGAALASRAKSLAIELSEDR